MIRRLLTELARDERGFVISSELVLVATILVIGSIVGLSELSGNINREVTAMGAAFIGVNQASSSSGAEGDVVGANLASSESSSSDDLAIIFVCDWD